MVGATPIERTLADDLSERTGLSPLNSLPSTQRILQALQLLDGLAGPLSDHPISDAKLRGESDFELPRCEHRLSLGVTVAMQPMDANPWTVTGELRRAEAVNMSVSGICLAHKSPIAFRHVAVIFGWRDGLADALITRLIWCRFTRGGEYYSGGRFVDALHLELAEPPSWGTLLPTA